MCILSTMRNVSLDNCVGSFPGTRYMKKELLLLLCFSWFLLRPWGKIIILHYIRLAHVNGGSRPKFTAHEPWLMSCDHVCSWSWITRHQFTANPSWHPTSRAGTADGRSHAADTGSSAPSPISRRSPIGSLESYGSSSGSLQYSMGDADGTTPLDSTSSSTNTCSCR